MGKKEVSWQGRAGQDNVNLLKYISKVRAGAQLI